MIVNAYFIGTLTSFLKSLQKEIGTLDDFGIWENKKPHRFIRVRF